jgi:subtilase family serine protease
LDSGEFEHPVIVRPTSMRGSKSAAAAVAQTAAVSNSDFFSSQCFTGTESESFSTNSDGELPKVTFSGNKLNQESLSGPGCGYTPAEIQTAYNLTGLYAEGYNGKGQTIAIVDWCGSFTIQADANAFSKKFGLPQLTSSNFSIIYTAPSECIAFCFSSSSALGSSLLFKCSPTDPPVTVAARRFPTECESLLQR